MNKKYFDDLKNDHYKQFVGCYVKRFYAPFKPMYISKIVGFIMKYGVAHFVLDNGQESDVEDSVVIADLTPMSDDERVADVKHPDYRGWNPYTNSII